jgi:hypothetical protein
LLGLVCHLLLLGQVPLVRALRSSDPGILPSARYDA